MRLSLQSSWKSSVCLRTVRTRRAVSEHFNHLQSSFRKFSWCAPHVPAAISFIVVFPDRSAFESDAQMALSRGSGSSVFGPLSRSSIFDPLENYPLLSLPAFPSFPQDVLSMASAKVDWVETPEAHLYKADLPGLKKEQVKVQVTDDNYLSISGERSREEVTAEDSYRHVERLYGKFSRQFKLAENAKPQEISAKMENGVLTVTVPKCEVTKESSKVQDVQITK